MGRDRAAYMRDYRASKRAASVADESLAYTSTVGLHEAQARIAELEAEVARLKRELANRPKPLDLGPRIGLDATLDLRTGDVSFNSRPFTPVPKRGK